MEEDPASFGMRIYDLKLFKAFSPKGTSTKAPGAEISNYRVSQNPLLSVEIDDS